MNADFKKPATMGVNTPNSYFSEDGQSGFSISSYDGRMSLKFWKKGEKSSENKDNSVSLNVNQCMLLNNMLEAIVRGRDESYIKNSEEYDDIDISLNIEGFYEGRIKTYGIIKFDTVEIDGIKRVRMIVTRESTINMIVFCDKIMKGALNNCKTKYDILDISFVRFCMDISNYCSFSSWHQGAFNKVLNLINPSSNRSGGNDRYQKPQSDNGYNRAPRREASPSNGMFDDDGEVF